MKPLLLLGAFFATLVLASAQDVAFIAHPASPDASLTAADVKNILLGTKTNWSSGAIKLMVQADGAVHAKVIQDFTQRSPDQFDKYWKKQVFTGKGTMPAVGKSDAEVLAFVSSTPGAFGYVARAAATDKVRTLEIK